MIEKCSGKMTTAEIGLYLFVLGQKYPLYYENTTIPVENPIQYLDVLTGQRNDEFIRKTAASILEKMKSEKEGDENVR